MQVFRSGISAIATLTAALLLAGCVEAGNTTRFGSAPSESFIARAPMGWERHTGNKDWTIEALAAVTAKDALLSSKVPADIATWCPGYKDAPIEQRRAFWVGLMNAVAKHESTWNPRASGGGGRYIGLMQISPATAKLYKCDATSAAALKDGGQNLSCAVEIFSKNVARDGVVAGNGSLGIGRDWGPFRKSSKRAEMAAVTSAQPWCAGSKQAKL
ncbi:transglycosylase SLT domain-containing protein [Pseudogemmobacter faecipullorum]|uniref:Transglycosylase SLT domain-containing protein n=1 Tax=Pseudogemmobacter faecipullorum TaxID=2755041 RepID=A0ABS8CIN1_9RHOB|nr:transglycosylase SLT domain-containing protein [Pseudogemmobacter faecipullorum]MCB5409244.1 transglycosylase SLT domain-containing protein [Pseudogemmobacter faecipullorum]